MLKLFQAFLLQMKANFRRIASATKHEATAEDLQQEAWLIAQDIGAKRGREIDFSDADDQSLVIRAVNHRNVKRGDWNMRRSIRIDQDPDDAEGIPRWADLIPANASSDPLIELLQRESSMSRDALLAASYSQASAYVMVFMHFKNDRQAVCSHLVVSNYLLSQRVGNAADTVRVQPSLFDRLERIGASFLPSPGRKYTVQATRHLGAVQWGWTFEEESAAFV